MRTGRPFRLATCAAFMLILVTATATAAPRDRRAPTRPTNLHTTAVTAWSVSLAWNASSDSSPFSYTVIGSHGQAMIVPQTQTSCIFTAGFQHRGAQLFQQVGLAGILVPVEGVLPALLDVAYLRHDLMKGLGNLGAHAMLFSLLRFM